MAESDLVELPTPCAMEMHPSSAEGEHVSSCTTNAVL